MTGVALTELDCELLEQVALPSAWCVVREEFAARYGGVAALAGRLVALEHAELLVIRSTTAGAGPASVAVLEADAALDEGVHPVDAIERARWHVLATEKGFAAIRDRLRAE